MPTDRDHRTPAEPAEPADDHSGTPEQAPTGLGSGTGSGLAHSLTSEPEPLLEDTHPEDAQEDQAR